MGTVLGNTRIRHGHWMYRACRLNNNDCRSRDPCARLLFLQRHGQAGERPATGPRIDFEAAAQVLHPLADIEEPKAGHSARPLEDDGGIEPIPVIL